jgi:hypothetical protein
MSILSKFGPPALVFAVTRILLLPCWRDTLRDWVAQVVQAPVLAKVTFPALVLSLTVAAHCRFPELPLAYRKTRVYCPAAGTLILFHSMSVPLPP